MLISDQTCDYGGQDTPFMQAITTAPGLMALFSAHDHGDTWCYKWDKLVPGMVVKGNGISEYFKILHFHNADAPQTSASISTPAMEATAHGQEAPVKFC